MPRLLVSECARGCQGGGAAPRSLQEDVSPGGRQVAGSPGGAEGGGAPSTAGARGDPLPLLPRQWEKATDLRVDLTGPTSGLAPLRPAPAGDPLPGDLGCDSQPRGLLGPAGAALNSGLDSEPDVVRERVSESAVRLRTRPELKAMVTLREQSGQGVGLGAHGAPNRAEERGAPHQGLSVGGVETNRAVLGRRGESTLAAEPSALSKEMRG